MIQYKQLSFEQRYTIETMLKQDISKALIARTISRSLSTLYRELKRNKRPQGASDARMPADERKKEGHYKTVFSPTMKRLIKEKPEDQWSPEQITG